jgi:hypothetical protein
VVGDKLVTILPTVGGGKPAVYIASVAIGRLSQATPIEMVRLRLNGHIHTLSSAPPVEMHLKQAVDEMLGKLAELEGLINRSPPNSQSLAAPFLGGARSLLMITKRKCSHVQRW